MVIRNENELVLFEEILNRCQSTVWLISTCGKQYDLKKPLERCLGIAEILKSQGINEPEVFTTSYGDEMHLFEFIARQKADEHLRFSVSALARHGGAFLNHNPVLHTP